MSDIRGLLEKIYEKNIELGWDQKISEGQVPEAILMIDKKTRKPLSPKMRDLYEFGISWKEGLTGFDIVDPNSLDDLYENSEVEESIRLKAEDYKPVPPSDISDWSRTALLAVEDGGRGLGICFYWWRLEEDVEPCIIYISGGSINIFIDLLECAEHFSDGIFPEKGDQVYRELEQQRGTLSD